MKEVEKLDKKIKRTKWLNKHFNKIILGVGLPSTFLGQFLLPFSPLLGLCFTLISFFTYSICGLIYLYKYQDDEYLILLEKQRHYAKTADAETIKMLERTIENYKKNPTMVKDEPTTRSLINDLIQIKKAANRALIEKQNEQSAPKIKQKSSNKHVETSLNI